MNVTTPVRTVIRDLSIVLSILTLVHLVTIRKTEPFFNNDETRHVMTGVFMRDALHDIPQSVRNPQAYAIRYYSQYPALGLLTWPPFFYVAEGGLMSIGGVNYVSSRITLFLFALVSSIYTYRFLKLNLQHNLSCLLTFIVGMTPLIFQYSQIVMLELPTFAMALVSIVHFEHYLRSQRGRDALLAGLFAALAALTRFDAVFLLPYFGLRLLSTRQWRVLLHRHVIVAIVFAGLLTGPYYAMTYMLYGSGISQAAGSGTHNFYGQSISWLDRVMFYPRSVPEQVGIAFTLTSILGLIVTITQKQVTHPAVALCASVWLVMTPLAEYEARHAIYWIPGLAVFTGSIINWLTMKFGNVTYYCTSAILLVSTITTTLYQPTLTVNGYEPACQSALAHRTTHRPIFVDGEFTGSMVFHIRKHDPGRKVWVLRGDKLIYAMLSDPNTNYQQYAKSEQDVIAILNEYDPEIILVEDPPPQINDTKGAELIVRTLRNHPEQFQFIEGYAIQSNWSKSENARIRIYRKLNRNPNPRSLVEMQIMGLGRKIGATKE